MRNIFQWITAISLLVASSLAAMPASAQVVVSARVAAPVFTLQIGAPLVYASPNVWVLPDSEEEVFYTGGWYWARHDGYWYRSHGHRSGWVSVQPHRVPRSLMRIEHGHYRHWHAPPQARRMKARGWEPRREHPASRPQYYRDNGYRNGKGHKSGKGGGHGRR